MPSMTEAELLENLSYSYDLDQFRSNANSLKVGLDLVAKMYDIENVGDTNCNCVVDAVKSMCDRLAIMKQLAENNEVEALIEVAKMVE